MNRGFATRMSRLTLHVIDGTSVLFRAYYGAGSVVSPSGEEIGGLEGFSRSMEAMTRRLRPTHAVVVFDSGGPTFRHELDPSYKANRDKPAPELQMQLARTPGAATELGYPVLDAPGFEADDIMATLAGRSLRAAVDCVLVTPDKDCLQLVSEGVAVMDPTSWTMCGPSEVRERLGVTPEHVVDFLALAGDPSDNVPGVPGVGPKTARALVNALGSIDSILARLDEVGELPIRGARSLAGKLDEHRDAARHSLELVRLRADVPLPDEFTSLRRFRLRDDVSRWTESGAPG